MNTFDNITEEYDFVCWADQSLTQEQQEKLMNGFEKIEEERPGPGKHEEFHQLIHRLEEGYAK